MTEQEQLAQLWTEYQQLTHAMQSGVATEMGHHPKPTEPKHLRVGVNSAMVDHGALVSPLISKGVITELEYATAVRDGMKAEVERYEQSLTQHYGRTITLG